MSSSTATDAQAQVDAGASAAAAAAAAAAAQAAAQASVAALASSIVPATVPQFAARDALVWKIKELQKTDPIIKEQWVKYAMTEGGGTKDPARHDAAFLQRFLEIRETIQVQMPIQCNLADFFREACKQSPTFKTAWGMYRQGMGDNRSDDPARHSRESLSGALEFMAQSGLTMMSMGGLAPEGDDWGQNKRQRTENSGMPPEKLMLVNKVKDLQKSGDEQKQAWWNFAQMHGQNKDPARFEESQLREFLTMQGVYV